MAQGQAAEVVWGWRRSCVGGGDDGGAVAAAAAAAGVQDPKAASGVRRQHARAPSHAAGSAAVQLGAQGATGVQWHEAGAAQRGCLPPRAQVHVPRSPRNGPPTLAHGPGFHLAVSPAHFRCRARARRSAVSVEAIQSVRRRRETAHGAPAVPAPRRRRPMPPAAPARLPCSPASVQCSSSAPASPPASLET